MTRRALAIAPRDPQALADLGAQLLRTGDEPAGRTSLEASFAIDPYAVSTYNMLQMLDSLDKFETIRDGDLIVKLHKDEAPVLKEYVIALAHKALPTMSAKYEMTVKGPILIEMFPKHDDFAVRTVGLPGMIGALGACFGRVVTLDSPRARQQPGDFLWEATLWHELGHVITLQMSNQRVPRWLTEGISEWEETQARKDWTRPGDAMFAGVLNRGEGIKLRDFNESFQDPKRIGLAYYQGRLVVDYMVREFGQASLNRLLRAYGQGLDTDTALKQILNTDLALMQKGFDQYLEREFGDLQRALVIPEGAELLKTPIDGLEKLAKDNPKSYPIQQALAIALRKAGRVDDAMKAFERALVLAPTAAGNDSPHAQLAEIALEKNDRTRAISELTALMNVDFENLPVAQHLAALLREANVTDPARTTAGLRAHRRARSVRQGRAGRARPHRALAQRGGVCRARVPHRHRAQADRSGRRPRRSRRELSQGRQTRRGEAAGAGGARNRADVRARTGSAAAAHRARRSPQVTSRGSW